MSEEKTEKTEKKERKKREKRIGIIQMIEITKEGKASFSQFDSRKEAKEYIDEIAKGSSNKDGFITTKDGGQILLLSGKVLFYREEVIKRQALL